MKEIDNVLVFLTLPVLSGCFFFVILFQRSDTNHVTSFVCLIKADKENEPTNLGWSCA